MKIKFLGTGTSHGVPVLGCNCKTCKSNNPKNKRYRTSIYIKEKNVSLIIDTPAEFRLRCLEYNILNIDGVLYTHQHADHTAGLDDLRRFNEINKSPVDVYSNRGTLNDIKKRFFYIFENTQEGGGKPKINFIKIKPFTPFFIKRLKIIPLKVKHGELDILSFKIKNFVYMTDVSFIPKKTFSYLKNIDVLVLDALRYEPHPTHFSLNEAIEIAKKINAKKTFFTHISHVLEHEKVEKSLPQNMFLAYDGLEINIK